MRINSKIGLALAFCSLALSSAMADTASERMARNEMHLAAYSPPVDFDPIHLKTYSQKAILKSVYETLVQTTDDGALMAGLGFWDIEWEKKAYVFHLDPKAQFEDGQPILAQDVAWSLSRHFWPSSQSHGKILLKNLAGDTSHVREGQIVDAITILDPHKIRIAVKKLSVRFLKNLSSPFFGILPRQRFHGLSPIASGPMTAKRDPKTGFWTLLRNPKYIGQNAGVQKILIVPVNSSEDVKKLIHEHEVDLLLTAPLDIQSNLTEELEIREIPEWQTTHLYFNRDKKLFAEKDFRKDLTLFVQNALLDIKKKSKSHELLYTYMPHGVLPSAYYKRDLPQALKTEEFKKKWGRKQGPIVIVNGYLELDQHAQEIIMNAFERVGLKVNWIPLTDKNKKILAKRDYDLFLETKYALIFPSYGLNALKLPHHPIKQNQHSMKQLLENMDKALLVKGSVARAYDYAKAFRAFENEYDFIPLMQSSFNPVLVNKKLHVPVSVLDAFLWKAKWSS